MKKTGRPRKNSTQKRRIQFSFYATADEALLIDRAKKQIDPDDKIAVSAFLREVVVKSIRRTFVL